MNLVLPTSDLSVFVNILGLLFNIYKSTKPSVAAKLDELIQELKRVRPAEQLQTRVELEKRLEEKLLPEIGLAETEAVKRDFDLIEVFSEPIDVGDFDYLNTLVAFGGKYAALADKAALFELRGMVEGNDGMLRLPTAPPPFDADESATLLCASTWPDYLTPSKVSSVDFVLAKNSADFSLKLMVMGDFKLEDRRSFSSRNVSIMCPYVLKPEGRKNWITFEPSAPVEGFRWVSKRFEGKGLLELMQAIRRDVMNYVVELRKERVLMKGKISALLQEVAEFLGKQTEP